MVVSECLLVKESITDCVHNEAHAHNASAVDKTGSCRRQIPRVFEGVGGGTPESLQHTQHGIHIAGSRFGVPVSVENAVAQTVLEHFEDRIVLDNTIAIRRSPDLPFKGRIWVVVKPVCKMRWESSFF